MNRFSKLVNFARRVTVGATIAALSTFGLATPSQADITSFSTSIVSGTVRISYQWTAPAPAAQVMVKFTSTTDSSLVWIVGASPDTQSANGTIVMNPKDMIASNCTFCIVSKISAPAAYTHIDSNSREIVFLPNGVYTTQMYFLNSLGTLSESTTSSLTTSLFTMPPTVTTSYYQDSATVNRFVMRFPGTVMSTVGYRANITLKGVGSCSASSGVITLTNPAANTDVWVNLDMAGNGGPSISSSVAATTSGLETLVRGCQYNATVRWRSAIGLPALPNDPSASILPNDPAYASAMASKTVTMYAPIAPDAPTTPALSSNSAISFDASWVAPSFDGFTAITNYNVRITRPSLSPQIYMCGPTLNCTVPGFGPDEDLAVEVQAVNAAGSSPWLSAGNITLDRCNYLPGSGINWTGCNKANSDFTDVNFGGANFTNANLSGSNFTGANLTFANLSGANLANATFSNTTGVLITGAETATLPANWAVEEGVLGTIPAAPGSVTTARGDESIELTWTAPASDGGLSIDEYEVSNSNGPVNCVSTGVRTCEVRGLTEGDSYSFSIRARNNAGLGAATSASTVTAIAAPTAPRLVRTSPSDDALVVSWQAPASNGGAAITGYRVTANPGNHVCTTSATSCLVTGLENGSTYSVDVVAINEAGDGATASVANAVPYIAPEPPTGVTGIGKARSTTVSWTAPADNGNAITLYTVYSVPARSSCTSTTTSCTVYNLLPNVNYSFKVVASNQAGGSLQSEPSAAIKTLDLPAVPTKFAVKPAKGSAKFTWAKSASTGGSPILNYSVTILQGNKSCTSTGTTCTIKGLKAKTSYTAVIKVKTALGTNISKTRLSFKGK